MVSVIDQHDNRVYAMHAACVSGTHAVAYSQTAFLVQDVIACSISAHTKKNLV